MAMIEDAIVNLKVDDSDASTKWLENKESIKDLNQELRKLREAGEAGSDGYKAIQSELKGLKAEQKEMLHNVDLTTASINQMQDAVNFWTREAKKAEQGSEEWINATKKIDEIKPILNEAQSELRGFGVEVEKQPGLWDTMKVSVLSVFTGLGLLELVKSAGQAFFDFGKEIFETTAKFEKYETVLTTALGSQGEAAEAMSQIKKIAAETPFSVDELTNSYIKYVNRGLTPTMEEMTKLGDIASSQGKSFEQLTEAVLDAGTGEFERLKEFGIQASKSGDQVALSFKGVNETVAFTPEAIQGAILAFGEMEGVVGGMAAISSTLEGRVSNLGDQFDNLKLILGDALMPAFDWLLGALKDGLTFVTDLITGNSALSDSTGWLANVFESLGVILGTIWDTFVEVVDIGAQLFVQLAKITEGLFETSGGASLLEGVMQAVSIAFRVVGSLLIATVTGLTVLSEGFNVLVNKGKEVANFFGQDFKIDTSATWENLNKHAEENISGITKLWEKSGADTEKVHNDTADTHKKSVDKQSANSKAATDKAVKEAQKAAKDKEKAEADLIKKVADMEIKAIADDTKRKVAKANLDYKRELDNIKKSKANEATKNKAIQALEKAHEIEILKISDDARKKEEAEQAKALKAKEATDKKAAAEAKKLKDQAVVDTKKMLDDEFVAEINKAKISLALTRSNSQAQFDAKRNIAELEAAHKIEMLQREANAEKARIAESIADNETKAARIRGVEDRLASEVQLIETNLQNAKTKITEEGNKAREKSHDDFYKGLNLAMKGDFEGFTKFLQQKAKDEGKHLNERMVATAKNAEEIGTVLLTAINTLMELNAKYTKDKIDKLEKEKQKNIEKLKSDFENGIITKEELEAGINNIQEKFDEKAAALKKKEFDRNKKMQIAQALIQGSLAVLNALATPPWVVGVAMAIVAAAKTAIDINKIKNTKFEGATGGTYFKNAGVAKGGRHGSTYGEGGIAMYDRATGAEVGEIEGDEPVMVLSRNTYRNNGPLIDRLLHSSVHRNGEPVTMASGGVVPISRLKYGTMLMALKYKMAAQ
jgi:hypothetical protein